MESVINSEAGCTLCEELWSTYEKSILHYFRIKGQFNIARLCGEEDAFRRLNADFDAAERARDEARQALELHRSLHVQTVSTRVATA